MSDSYSAGKYAEAAVSEMQRKDCTSDNKAHQWKAQTPYYGMAQCMICKKTVYTK